MGVVIKYYIICINSRPFATRFDIFVYVWLKAKATGKTENQIRVSVLHLTAGYPTVALANIFYITLKGRS